MAATLTLQGESTLHFGWYRNNVALREGLPLTGSFDSESSYVTYTVYFPPPRIRRNNFLSWAGAIFCAGSVSIVAAAAAPHDPIADTALIAGAVGHVSRLPASTTSSHQFLYQHHETSRRETGATGFFIVSTRALALVPIVMKSPYRDTEPIDRRNRTIAHRAGAGRTGRSRLPRCRSVHSPSDPAHGA